MRYGMPPRPRSERRARLSLLLPLLVGRDLRAVLQFAADDGVAAGDDLFAGLHARFDLDVRRVGDAGFDAALLHGVTLADVDDALELVTRCTLLLFVERFI